MLVQVSQFSAKSLILVVLQECDNLSSPESPSYLEHSLQIRTHPIEPDTILQRLLTLTHNPTIFSCGFKRVAKFLRWARWLQVTSYTCTNLSQQFFFFSNSPWASVGVTVTMKFFFTVDQRLPSPGSLLLSRACGTSCGAGTNGK